MKVDFNKLKQEISLPDFLHDHFRFELTQGSTRTSPKMKGPDGQVIVIKKNHSGVYTYWDVHNDGVKGSTIIDFMQEQIQKDTGKLPSLREVGEILQKYVDIGKTVVPSESSYSVNNELMNAEAILKIVKYLKPLTDTSFLEKRGIMRDTLEKMQFKHVFMQREYISGTVVYNNTCVKLVNASGVLGISQRNEFFKGCLGARYDTIAASNIDTSRPIEMLYIGESMIDCISHFQMKYQGNTNVLYVSTEGSLADGQIDTINQLIGYNKIQQIAIIFDNDRAGSLYTLKLLGKVKIVEQEELLTINKIEVVGNDAGRRIHCEIDVEGDNKEDMIDEYFPKEVAKQFHDSNAIKLMQTDAKRFALSFPFVQEVLLAYSYSLIKKRFGYSAIIDLPQASDFNDDLKNNQYKAG